MKLGDLMAIYSAVMRLNEIEFRVDPGRRMDAEDLFEAISQDGALASEYRRAVSSVRNTVERIANLQFTMNPDMAYRVVDRPKKSVDLNEAGQ